MVIAQKQRERSGLRDASMGSVRILRRAYLRGTERKNPASKERRFKERHMDDNIADEILSELFSALEDVQTQSSALCRILKDKGVVTAEELAPYLEQAGKASDVQWRAARLRINSLLSSALKRAEESIMKKAEQAKKEGVAEERETAQPNAEKTPTGQAIGRQPQENSALSEGQVRNAEAEEKEEKRHVAGASDSNTEKDRRPRNDEASSTKSGDSDRKSEQAKEKRAA
jgi:hypothetical protein